MADLSIQNEGSIFLLRGLTEAGKAWIAEHIPDDAPTFGAAVVIEHHFIGDIAQGAVNDGLEVE
jgi:hypothetical protein